MLGAQDRRLGTLIRTSRMVDWHSDIPQGASNLSSTQILVHQLEAQIEVFDQRQTPRAVLAVSALATEADICSALAQLRFGSEAELCSTAHDGLQPKDQQQAFALWRRQFH